MNTKTPLAIILFTILVSTTALADRITPNHRVETRLNVRASANSDSTFRGHLDPGDTAELEDSVAYWYEITMDDGTPGFVSKAYSRVIPTVPASQILRLGSWNIKKLGHGSSKNYPLTAQIIEANFDILAVVEVMQKGGDHPGYDDLVTQLGSDWAGMVTSKPRPNTNAGHAEFYAVVYRTSRVTPCVGWSALIYHVDNDGGSTGTGEDRFSREPAFGCFVAGNFDFILAPYHAVWADGDIDDISAEVGNIDDVFASMLAAQAGEKDLLISGDFNLVPTDLASAINKEIPTVGTGSTLNGDGVRT